MGEASVEHEADFDHSAYLPVEVAGQQVFLEARPVGDDEEEVASRAFAFPEFTASLTALTQSVTDAVLDGFERAKPSKLTMEFGCEVGVESGKLTAILVKGTGKANIKVTMEWSPPS
ncbi:CU044_2847 family protein [Amycolatopsis magusensis]|uniref:CU044_2847 family protein n=1 Tax=Amycolatopsis magusensis TaxID=882444 RepID=UPI00378C08DF